MLAAFQSASLSGLCLSLAACATESNLSVERVQDFRFSPHTDGTILVDAFLYFPDTDDAADVLSAADVMYEQAASTHCQGKFEDVGDSRWCHAAQPKDLAGTVLAVCKTIRCVGAA